ncbi:exosome complex component RRP43-like [Trichogramma pretiosum]|uniref:exosome complex component RRP43-like n=1 Tax=Trichogramma pretiosum TaxID=7493 RepID=UPI0006C96A23|nr:exosome complex component RRP43-like [Trichogramma pretiosum]
MEQNSKEILPARYLNDHIKADTREDGRDFLSFRPVSVNVGSIKNADSSAVCRIGNTGAVCGIKAELGPPHADAPDVGIILPIIELSGLCSQRFRPGLPNEEAMCIAKIVEDILINSKAIDLTDLCIHKGKLVWILNCQIMCTNADGAVVDCCIAALMAALKNLTVQKVEYTPESNEFKKDPVERVSIPLKQMSIRTSFALLKDDLLIADPTSFEEDMATSMLSLAYNEKNEIVYLHKPGGDPISDTLLKKAMSKAKSHTEQIRTLISTAQSTVGKK